MTHHSHSHAHPHAAPHTEGVPIHWASRYDAVVRLWTLGQDRKLRQKTIDLAGIQPGEHVLDVGCGTADLTLLAAGRAGAAGRVCGLDAAPEMIEVARRKAAEAGAAVEFELGVVEALPYPEASFDVVLSSLMMHHLPGDLKRAALVEIRRVLKPGGRVLVVDLRRPANGLERFAMHLLMHGRLRDGVGELAPLMQAAGLSQVETGSMGFGVMGYARGRAEQ